MIPRIPTRHLAAMAVAYVAGVLVYPYLPEDTPGRPMIAFLLPTTALLTCVLLGWLWKRDPIRHRDENGQATYEAILFRIVLFVCSIQMVVVTGLLERAGVVPHLVAPAPGRSVPILLGIALMAIGNLLPRMKPNVVIGIRTSRTLADQAAWNRTNRVAGYVAVALGAALVVIGVLMAPPRAQPQQSAFVSPLPPAQRLRVLDRPFAPFPAGFRSAAALRGIMFLAFVTASPTAEPTHSADFCSISAADSCSCHSVAA